MPSRSMATLAVTLCAIGGVTAQDGARPREDLAPEFSFVADGGERVSSAALRGKEVLLDFWATWCGPCRQAQPSLDRLQRTHAGQPFVLVAVSGDRDEGEWRRYLDSHKPEGPQYLDRDRALRRLFRVNTYPTYILIDHDGVVRGRYVGWSTSRAALIEDGIDRALKTRGQR